MNTLLAVGIGGCLGALSRYGIAQAVNHWRPAESGAFPIATLAANLIGCLVIGLLFGWTESRGALAEPVRLFLFTGLLGGFTTFSSFGLETIQLLKGHHGGTAFLYVAISVLLGLLLVWLGYSLMNGAGGGK